MKLAFCLFRYFPYSGLSRVFLSIVNEMAKRGHKIDAYVYEWQGEFPEGININLLPSGKWTNHNRDAAYYKTVRPFLVAGNYDAVIGFNKMPELDFYYAGDFCYIDRISSKYSDIYRLTPRHHHFARFEKEVFGVQSETVLLMLSQREKQIYQQNYGTDESRFVILPPALDKNNVISNDVQGVRTSKRLELGLQDDELLVLFVGSGFRTKGLDRAIQAISDLPVELKIRTRLMIVGQDNPHSYKQRAAQLGISDSVQFTGGRFDVPELMLAADLLIHPAYREAAGNVLLEAIASGLPVLTTDNCGYATHISDAKAGDVLQSPVTQEQISSKLSEMLLSDQRLNWSDNGRKYGQREDLYAMPVFTANIIEKKVPAIISKKLQNAEKYVTQKSTNYYLTYRKEFESQQLKQLFFDPDEYLQNHAINIIKHDQTTTVAVIECDDDLFVLKRYNTKGVWHFFKRSVRITRASICWNFAHRLLQTGLSTPTPVGYRENRVGQLRGRSYYVAKFSPGVTLLDYLKENIDEQKLDLATKLMKNFFATMGQQNLAHGDLKASNFLIRDENLEVLDLDSMRSYQSNQFHQHKLFRDKRRFLRNWLQEPEVYQHFKQALFSVEEQNRLSQVSTELNLQD